MTNIIIRLPTDSAASFMIFWKDLRIAEGLDLEDDLDEPMASDNFDGAALSAWIMTMTPLITPLLGVIFGFLISKRGEIEIHSEGKVIKMKNIKPSQLNDFLKVINDNA